MLSSRTSAFALLLGSALIASSATAQNCVTTTFAGGTSTSSGRTAALVDVSVNATVIIQSVACNFASSNVPITLEVWTTPGTWVNNQATQALWTLQSVDTGGVVTATPGQPTTFTMATPFQLAAGSYGVYIIANGAASHRYSSASATVILPIVQSDGVMTITTGAMDTTPFNGTANLNPRGWNGTICYQLGMGTFANFTANSRTTSPFGSVQFTDTTFTSDPGGVVAWAWDFDNNGTTDSTVQNPSYTYPTCGTFDVKLTATDASAVSSTVTKTGYITSQSITLAYTVSDAAPAPGQVVTFTSTSTTTDPGGIVTTDWDFTGDGVTDASGASVMWTYGAGACGLAQNVRITCSDAVCNNSRTDIGRVTPRAPTVSFTAMVLAPTTPIPVQFTDTSLGAPTAWSWDLDGDMMQDSTDQNPVFLYAAPGVYNVSLTATNACGSTTATQPVNIIGGSPVCTTFAAGNGQVGNFFDVIVTNPAGITVRSLDVHFTTGITAAVEVWTIPGGYLGNTGSNVGWTLRSTEMVTSAGTGLPSPMNSDDFCLAPGTYGFAVLAPGSTLQYTNGTGAAGTTTAYAGFDLTIRAGLGTAGFGLGNFDPRIWNGCIHYTVGTAGSYEQIGTGCLNSTGNIAGNTMTGGTLPTYGQPMSFTISNAPANEPLSFMMLGFYDVGGPDLGLIGMPGCPLHADGVLSLIASTNASGIGVTAPFGIPNDPAQVGAFVFTQPFIKDLGTNAFGAVTGVARKATIGCP